MLTNSAQLNPDYTSVEETKISAYFGLPSQTNMRSKKHAEQFLLPLSPYFMKNFNKN